MWLGKLFHGRSAKVEAEWSVFQAQSLPVFVLFFPLCFFSERDQNNGIQLRLQRYLVSFVEGRPKSHWTFFFCCLSGKSVKKWCKKSATPNLKKKSPNFSGSPKFRQSSKEPDVLPRRLTNFSKPNNWLVFFSPLSCHCTRDILR